MFSVNTLESSQIEAACKFSNDFRRGRTPDELFEQEFCVDKVVLVGATGGNVLHYSFVVPNGRDILMPPPRQQWTTTSSRIFCLPSSERVEPLISPSAVFQTRNDASHFSLAALMEHVFQRIPRSGKSVAAWSAPDPYYLFWDNIRNGLIYTPENAKRWVDSYCTYCSLLLDAMQDGDLHSRAKQMYEAVNLLGISGPWADMYCGKLLPNNVDSVSLINSAVLSDPRKQFNMKLSEQLRKMKRLYEEYFAKYVSDPAMLELFTQPVPVMLPVIVPSDQPGTYFEQGIDDTFLAHSQNLAESDTLPVRHPTAGPFAWRKGIYPDDIDPERPIYVHSDVSDVVLKKMMTTVSDQWGLANPVIRLDGEKVFFVKDCRIGYQPEHNDFYTQRKARQDIRSGRLVPLFDVQGQHPHAIFSEAEYWDYLSKLPNRLQ